MLSLAKAAQGIGHRDLKRANIMMSERGNFGTFSGTRGSFSDIGTGRMHHLLVGRFDGITQVQALRFLCPWLGSGDLVAEHEPVCVARGRINRPD